MALGYTFSVLGDCYSSGNTGSIQIFPSGGVPPYDFVWCCGLGTNTGVMSSVKTGLSGGTYTITISDSAIIPETITAGVYVSPGVCVSTIDSTDTTCGDDNGDLTVSAATPYTPVSYYLYDGSNNFVVSGNTPNNYFTIYGLSADTYNVDVFDSGGCSGNTGTCIIKSSTDINYGFYVIGNSNCAAGNTGAIYVTGLTGNPPFTYNWSTGAITTSIGGLTNGAYFLTITDATGCSKTLSTTISTVPTLGIVNFVNVSPTCFQNNGSVTVNISGGTPPYYYQFSNGLNVISYLQSYTISGLFANSYSVIVTDAGLCTTNGITSISVPNSFNAVSISVVNSTCSSLNGSIDINVSSTNALVYTYTLIDPLGNSTIVSKNSTYHSFGGLSGGTYTVTVTDPNPNGCFYTQDVHLFTDNKFTVSSSTTGTTCGGSNGSVTLTASTSGIYTYEITGGSSPIQNTSLTSVTFNNLVAGIYTATTTDNTGCVQYTTFVINSSSNVGFTLLSTFCGTGNQGTITALITSGNPPFTFNWSPNVGAQTGIYVTGLTAGTYSLTVIDDDGCQQTLTKDIVCGTNYASYELYNVCEGNFVETPSSKLGLLQMLNQGFNDLTSGATDCILTDAQFILNLYIGSTAYTNSFYSTLSLLDVPSDDLYVTTLTNLLNQVPNLGAININLNNNTIRINTDCERTLEGVEVKIDLKIVYDICCALQCDLSGGTAIVQSPCPNICSEWFWDGQGSTLGVSPSLSYYNCDGILTIINFPYAEGDKGIICVSGGTTPYYTNVTGGTVSDTNVPCCYSQMFISGITATSPYLIIKPTTYPVYVNWGDGTPIGTFNVGVSTTLVHNYSTPFTGLITVYSKSLSTIEELSVLRFGGVLYSVAIATTEIAKATSCKYFKSGFFTSVIGDVADLPNSLLTYLGYSDKLTGDIANIPPSITSFEVLGNNTLYGDIMDIPIGMTYFNLFATSFVTGDVASIPNSMQEFKVMGNSMMGNTIYGDIMNIPTSVIYFYLTGANTVTGDVSTLPPNIIEVGIQGNNTVSGLIENLPTTLCILYLLGYNTVSGDLSLIPTNITFFSVGGNNTIDEYSIPRVWEPNFQRLQINSASSGFDTAEVNQLLTDLANVPWSYNGLLEINGTGSPQYTNVTDFNNLVAGNFPINNPVIVTIYI